MLEEATASDSSRCAASADWTPPLTAVVGVRAHLLKHEHVRPATRTLHVCRQQALTPKPGNAFVRRRCQHNNVPKGNR